MIALPLLGTLSALFVAGFTWHAYRGPDTGAGQSRSQSIIEAWVNIVIGFSINFVANFFILPLVGAHITVANNLWLGCIFTAISVLRQYVIRRWFNRSAHGFAVWLAARFA